MQRSRNRSYSNLPAWHADFPARHPAFSVIAPAARELNGPSWPSLATLDHCLVRANIRNARGAALRVIEADGGNGTAAGYESNIFEHGHVAVRFGSWHDVFNVLVWRTFPAAKAALNARHCAALIRDPGEARRRGPVRDALTLFDESGVIIASSDASLLEAIEAHRWKELFWTRRATLLRSLRVCVFGHALYEKLLSPFLGLTGYAVMLEVEQSIIDAPFSAQIEALDALSRMAIEDPSRLSSPRDLQPFPLLGMPDWYRETDQEAFYNDPGYFRPGRGGAVNA